MLAPLLLHAALITAAFTLLPAIAAAEQGSRRTVHATRLPAPLLVDGRLDEQVYRDVPSVGDFIQQEPAEGMPATERTDVWIFYDDARLYIAARCWDSQPARLVANEMRRDSRNIEENDSLSIALDPFFDGRNGVLFHTNPVGGLYEALIIEEANTNRDWNTVWDVRTGRFADGWTAEIVIPFASLRYRGSGEQLWGLNVRRTVRWKNERSFLAAVPRAWKAEGINKLSLAAVLTGLHIPRGSRLREVKPYGLAGVLTSHAEVPPRVNDGTRNAGADVKFGLTRGLTLDLTVNTDFAQVESDDQQVNLTRFSLFFPEKREFFLEGQGIFGFAGNGGGRAETPLLFFSRRVGLNGSESVPIRAGARLSGRAGPYSIGLLSVRQEAADNLPAAVFSVARIKRDVQRRGTIGGILVHRSTTAAGEGGNLAGGADLRLWLHDALMLNGYFARTASADGSTGDSYRAQLEYTGDRLGAVLDFINVDPDFNPEAGFVRRHDMRRAHALLRYTQRPSASRLIRDHEYTARLSYFTDTAWRVQNHDLQLLYELNMHTGDDIEVRYAREFERLEEGFRIADRRLIPAGDYTAQEVGLAYEFGPQRRRGGELAVTRGSFYGGTRTGVSGQGRLEITPRVAVEPRVELNWIGLSPARFRTTLTGARINVAMTPRLLVAGLLQYNSTADSVDANLRLRWEYVPGSEFFVVFSEGRLNDRGQIRLGAPPLRNRTIAIKITRLVRL